MVIKVKSPRIPWVFSTVVLVVVVGIVVLGYNAYRNAAKNAYTEFNHRQMLLANGVNVEINTSFSHLRGEMSTLLRMLELRYNDPSLMRLILHNLYRELQPWGITNITLLDQNGKITTDVAIPQRVGSDYSDKIYIKELKKQFQKDPKHFVNGEVHTRLIEIPGSGARKLGLLLAAPILTNNTFDGMIICIQKLDFLTRKFVSGVQSSDRGHAFLVNQRSEVLWSPDPSYLGSNLLDGGADFPRFLDIFKAIALGKEGTGAYRFYKFDETEGRFTDEEEELLVAYRPIKIGDQSWSVAVWTPKEYVRQSLYSIYISQLMVVILCVLVIAIAYVYALIHSVRTGRRLEREVEKKTGQLEESHRRLLTIFNSLDVAVYAADMETGIILFANKYLQDIYGEIEGEKCFKVFRNKNEGPCEICSNPELMNQWQHPTDLNERTFETTVSGLWHERRERAIRWVDGRIVRLEIAMNAPCEPPPPLETK
jgi:PAS domain-containing protein